MYETEISIGTFLDDGQISWWGPYYGWPLLGFPKKLRGTIDSFAQELDKVPTVSRLFSGVFGEHWVFVEGESELAFLQRLKELGTLGSTVEAVETYRGKANATRSKIPIDHLRARGYRTSVQIDADGSQKKKGRELVEAVDLYGGTLFRFSRDFESSFPPEVLHHGLSQLGIDVDLAWLKKAVANEDCQLIQAVEQKSGKSISKPDLAMALAEVYNDNVSTLHEQYQSYEVVQWILRLLGFDNLVDASAKSDDQGQ